MEIHYALSGLGPQPDALERSSNDSCEERLFGQGSLSFDYWDLKEVVDVEDKKRFSGLNKSSLPYARRLSSLCHFSSRSRLREGEEEGEDATEAGDEEQAGETSLPLLRRLHLLLRV